LWIEVGVNGSINMTELLLDQPAYW
jgi:hypothetical protein